MINPAVNKNIDTPNSRAAMAQDKNIVSIINKTNKAIEARGGDIKNPASQAIINRAIMLYRQGGVKNIVTANEGTLATGGTTGDIVGSVISGIANNNNVDDSQKSAEELAAEEAEKERLAAEEAEKERLAAEAAEKERLAAMADKTLEGQRQLIVDINTDPTKAVEKATVATINKNAVGTTVDESVGKITAPIDLAGTKGEYVQPVETIEPVLTGEKKAKALDDIFKTIYQAVADDTYDEKYDLVAPFGEITVQDGIASQKFQAGSPVDQAVTDKMNALLEGARGTVTTPGYYKEGGPKGVATATDVEKPDDITASKVTTKTATGDIRSSLTGGERDYVTVPLENVKFDPIVFPSGEVPAELEAQLAPTEEEQIKINEVSATLQPQIDAAFNTLRETETYKAYLTYNESLGKKLKTEEEKAELDRLNKLVKETPEYKAEQALRDQLETKKSEILSVTFHNPTTGEKVIVDKKTAILSNPPEGFVKGEPEGKFKDGSLESAQGTVSEKAKVTAAQGNAKKITGTGLDKIAQLGTNIFDADGNVIVDKNGEPIKGNFTQIDALDETTKRKLQTEDIYDAEGNLVSKKETLDETGFTAAEQKDVDDTIAKTKAAQIDTGATDKYDAEGNLIRKGDRGYTVQAQLEGLMEDFEGGNTPSWAAGAMRQATATLAARGLGASSMAGQAIVQAAMESALPIAQADAATIAQFERDNLSNRQQVTVLASQQRAEFLKVEFDQKFQAKVLNAAKISEIANLNFTADQQITLENARLAQTANITNMNAKNAKTMADAAAMATMDLKNLDNKQQAAVQNAKTFLEMDLKNLDNRQEAAMFKAQSITSSILSDTAAENASRQFNASSENQTNQFMANLKTSVDLANAAQKNAISMANAAATNTLDTFNASMKEARAVLENQNGVTIAQSNAVWRQNAETLDTAAQNQVNMESASQANALTTKAVDQIWQQERDIMDYAHREAEALQERNLQLLLGNKTLEQYQAIADAQEDAAKLELAVDIIFD